MRSEAQVVITNPTGLHARPAVKLAQLAAGFDANVEVRAGDDGEWVRARSTARVMKLKAGAQSTIHFRAEGSQAADALSALVDFVRRDFDEGPADGAETPGEPAARAEDTSQGGRAIPAVVASPGLAIGILHMPASTNGATRQPGDASEERAAFDGAVARTIERLRLLADESGGLARDVIGFQIGLLEDEEFLGPVWSEIDAGLAADRAWAHHLAREIADYESAPTSYLRERAADLRDLRDGVAMAFAHDAHSDTLPEQCVVITDELTPSRFLELDRSRVVAVATRSGSLPATWRCSPGRMASRCWYSSRVLRAGWPRVRRPSSMPKRDVSCLRPRLRCANAAHSGSRNVARATARRRNTLPGRLARAGARWSGCL